MRSALSVFAPLVLADLTLARPYLSFRQADSNPFEGRQLYVNTGYSKSLEVTRQSFLDDGDVENAGKVQFIQEKVGTFVWVSNIDLLRDIDVAIEGARSAQDQTGEEQIVGLVLYNLPDRDCSAGESSGELSLADGGLERYMAEYVGPFAEKVLAAGDLQFGIVLEPDAVGNMVTGQDMEICRNAAEPQREGIAYAIQKLQADHVHLYIDASNGAWLGSEEHIRSAAAQFADIVSKAGNGARIRGFSTNVSNYIPFSDSGSINESSYVSSLAPAVEAQGLPGRFIVDQSRVALSDAGKEWCNVAAGFGQPATTETGNDHVDSIVWVKLGGESDGECGMEGAPVAGSWFNEYARQLTINAHEAIQPISS
ncbi:related to Endoglucanase-6B [Cephalotrichum gorgonifer]|uniref:Glucanase n=1 Tax=Cephalotrichum gorgonifer TaxID=2041049 RepID=A0AAE8N1J0_9PEZI|nr:related to Endoglucanase-6B [Cephalotrichum gorgonifer]